MNWINVVLNLIVALLYFWMGGRFNTVIGFMWLVAAMIWASTATISRGTR